MERRKMLALEECEKERIRVASMGAGCKSRVTTVVAKQILLAGPLFARGYLLNPNAKSLGAGVYEITWEVSP